MRKAHSFQGMHFCEGVHALALQVQGVEYETIFGYCVYAWFRGDECLYVGSSAHGLDRLSGHHIIGKVEPVDYDDVFHFFFGEKRSFEKELIREWQPKYNKVRYTTEPIQDDTPIPPECSAKLQDLQMQHEKFIEYRATRRRERDLQRMPHTGKAGFKHISSPIRNLLALLKSM